MERIIDRRGVLRSAGAGLIAVLTGGVPRYVTPAEARAENLDYRVLSHQQAGSLESLADVMLPGARNAGVAHYVDDQLAKTPRDSLLFVRYLDVAPPYLPFYAQGLVALEAIAARMDVESFASLPLPLALSLVRALNSGTVTNWSGPSSVNFYTAVRNDAIDVFYGVQRAMERLGIPAMEQVPLQKRW